MTGVCWGVALWSGQGPLECAGSSRKAVAAAARMHGGSASASRATRHLRLRPPPPSPRVLPLIHALTKVRSFCSASTPASPGETRQRPVGTHVERQHAACALEQWTLLPRQREHGDGAVAIGRLEGRRNQWQSVAISGNRPPGGPTRLAGLAPARSRTASARALPTQRHVAGEYSCASATTECGGGEIVRLP